MHMEGVYVTHTAHMEGVQSSSKFRLVCDRYDDISNDVCHHMHTVCVFITSYKMQMEFALGINTEMFSNVHT